MKIHALVDALGPALRFVLTPANIRQDHLPTLINGLRLVRDVLAHHGLFTRTVRERITAERAQARIPSQSNVRVHHALEPEAYRQR